MLRSSRAPTIALVVLALVIGWAVAVKPAAGDAYTPPAIKHVWIITLENESFAQTFGSEGKAQAPYLASTLPAQGAVLRNYYATGHESLDNYIAMVSGQASNPSLSKDCPRYSRFVAAVGKHFPAWTKYHQLSGRGCVYPKSVLTIANELTRHKLTWRAYEEDMGKDPARDKTAATGKGPACGHPKLGAIDLTKSTAPKHDSYATRHDPFMYFRSITDDHGYCDSHVLPLTPLKTALAKISTTPNYSFITPNTCSDGHDIPKCHDGSKGGLARANTFLKTWIPRIMASPAYQADGLIVINFDEASPDTNAAGCCGEIASVNDDDPSHPDMNQPGVDGPGGGIVGAVLLSKFIAPGTTSTVAYNHYSLLRSIEDIFGLPHLGDAQQPEVASFGPDVYTNNP